MHPGGDQQRSPPGSAETNLYVELTAKLYNNTAEMFAEWDNEDDN